MSEQHLWEHDHPYYCAESNYYSNETYLQYGSWEEFVEAEGNADFDWNLVFRWDWRCDWSTEDAASRRAYADRFGDRDHAFILQIFWMGQRKGLYRSSGVSVCKADEPAVREWLTARAEHMRLVWAPLLDAGKES